ncbi:hypothetical protein LWI29_013977 [Acer saccharum]|uniref:Zinc finger ZPR1-type domain-containing protein n=1 Tax=Acer saccharum TaxID=4024 RepID=A0AA39S3Q9_ACESA|nr:hypothetical protein LWI29_013977 [Acer saccharum]
MYGFEAMTFNIHGGYLEAIVRGHRSSLLTAADYNNLCQCETLDDIKMHLSATEYGPYLQNEPSPLHTTTIVEKCTLKLVDEYKHMLCQATEPMSTFLEYITYGHMIDNVVLIVTGTLHERDVQELLEKCHPLGMFDSIATLAVAQNMRELYRLVLVDTPLAPYFSECITSEDLDDMNIEIMRNTLYKAYLEDFYKFCQKLGGATQEIMSNLLAFEADRRAVNITINSIGTELTRDDRRKLYSNFGLLFPYGHEELAVCEDIDQVRAVMEKYPPYQSIFSKLSYGESQMLDKAFYEEEVKRLCLAFEQQFHYGVFFAYMRLREQEIRNLMWISECVAQNQKSRVHDSVLEVPSGDQKLFHRQVVKSESATIKIPELDFEIPPEAQRGSLSNLVQAAGELQALQEERKKVDPQTTEACAKGDSPFTLILDDPAGNGFIENLYAPSPDPSLSIKFYEQQAFLGYLVDPSQSTEEAISASDQMKRKPHGSVGAAAGHRAIALSNSAEIADTLFRY